MCLLKYEYSRTVNINEHVPEALNGECWHNNICFFSRAPSTVKRRESNQAQMGQARTWLSSAATASRPVARTACVPGGLVPSLPCALQDLSNAQRAWAVSILERNACKQKQSPGGLANGRAASGTRRGSAGPRWVQV